MKLPKFSARLKRPSPLIIRRVTGQSMAPTLHDGRIIFARTVFRRVKPQDIVVIDHDGLEKIKRIQSVRGSQIFVVGDNVQQSTDSRDFGWIDEGLVLGKVIRF